METKITTSISVETVYNLSNHTLEEHFMIDLDSFSWSEQRSMLSFISEETWCVLLLFCMSNALVFFSLRVRKERAISVATCNTAYTIITYSSHLGSISSTPGRKSPRNMLKIARMKANCPVIL